MQINDTKLFRSLKEARQLVEGDANNNTQRFGTMLMSYLGVTRGQQLRLIVFLFPMLHLSFNVSMYV